MNHNELIVFDKTRCLKMRHKASSCKVCQEVCHANAIDWQNDQLTLHLSQCTQCGACISACPQSSFSSASQGTAEQCLAQASCSTSMLTVACSEAQTSMSNVQIHCHHQLHPTLLLELAQRGVREIQLLTGQCHHCPKEANHNLALLVGETLTIATDLQIPLQIKLCERPTTKDLSKRAIFTHFLHKADTPVDHSYQADISTWFNPTQPHQPYVPEVKRRFYHTLQK